MLAILIVVPPGVSGLIAPKGVAATAIVVNGVELGSYVLMLAAGCGLYLRWRIMEEASVGWLAAALVTLSLPQVLFSMIELAVGPSAPLSHIGPFSRLFVAVPALLLMARSARARGVDPRVRPLTVGVATGLATGALTIGLTIATRVGPVPEPPTWLGATIDGMLAVVSVAVAIGFLRIVPLRPPMSAHLGAVAAGFAAGYGLRAVARAWEPLWFLASAAVLAAVILLALVTLSLLRSAFESNGVRMESLLLRADSAEESMRREQERLHELRSTVSGISQASRTLAQYGDRIDDDRKGRIEQMMSAELSRLERLLSTEEQLADLAPVPLDDVISPLVVCQRELGARITWDGSDAAVLGRADEISEVMHILLSNAHRHARGAPVEIVADVRDDIVRVVVHDEGPGVPPRLAHAIFDRGARSERSPGQGLGLYIARRLVADLGGRLELLRSTAVPGAHFVLTLHAARGRRGAAPRGAAATQQPAFQGIGTWQR